MVQANGGKDVFLHISALQDPTAAWYLEPGVLVEFSIEAGPKGLRATRAKVPPGSESRECQRLLATARDAGQALHAAGVEPESPATSVLGWKVIERVGRRDIVYGPRRGSSPARDEILHHEVWLTPLGDLQHIQRSECTEVVWVKGDVIDVRRSTSWEPGVLIRSLNDLRYGWDGPYFDHYPPDRSSFGEIIGQSAVGPRTHPATFIASALETITAALIEDAQAGPSRDLQAPGYAPTSAPPAKATQAETTGSGKADSGTARQGQPILLAKLVRMVKRLRD